MTDSELLPCPFCGGEPEIDYGLIGAEFPAGQEYVSCPTLFRLPDGDYARCGASQTGIAAWNRRAPVTVAQAARVLLEGLDGDGWRVAVNTMAPILRADLDQSAWASVTELREAFIAALTALAGEDQR